MEFFTKNLIFFVKNRNLYQKISSKIQISLKIELRKNSAKLENRKTEISVKNILETIKSVKEKCPKMPGFHKKVLNIFSKKLFYHF